MLPLQWASSATSQTADGNARYLSASSGSVCGGSPRDRDPYAWLEHFGPRIAEVQLQQSDGLADHHWPFTPERNATGLVDPGRVLDTLAGAGVTDVLLILEVIPPFEQDDRQVIGDLRASAEVWRRALAERGLAERGLS